MIAKGNQRGGGQQLASHLLNAQDNERIEIADIRGAAANDLHGAFLEWEAVADGTSCRKYLYSLSINPNPADGPLTREQYFDFIARAEKKHGLTGQARAVVFHVKQGRAHCHVVWSRIDLENMKAVHMAHDRQKIRAVVQEFARDHGLRLPRGMKNNRGLERFNDHALGITLAEKHQEERTGLTKEARQKEITEAWRQSDSGKAFAKALETKGYRLARGQRGYVVLDRPGEIHSLARQIEGVKTKEVKARLESAFPLENLPDAARLQQEIRERDRQKSEKTISEAFKHHAAKQWGLLKQKQHERRAALQNKRKTMLERHRAEREAFLDAQKKEIKALAQKRAQEKPRGLKGFLAKITGKEAARRKQAIQQDQQLKTSHKQARKALSTRQNREVRNMNRRFRALVAVEKRESRSLNTALQRRQFMTLTQEHAKAQRRVQAATKEKTTTPLTPEFARAATQPEQGKETSDSPARTPPQEAIREDIKQTGQDIVKPVEAEPAREENRLAEAFRRAKKQKEKREQQKDRSRDPGRGMSR